MLPSNAFKLIICCQGPIQSSQSPKPKLRCWISLHQHSQSETSPYAMRSLHQISLTRTFEYMPCIYLYLCQSVSISVYLLVWTYICVRTCGKRSPLKNTPRKLKLKRFHPYFTQNGFERSSQTFGGPMKNGVSCNKKGSALIDGSWISPMDIKNEIGLNTSAK